MLGMTPFPTQFFLGGLFVLNSMKFSDPVIQTTRKVVN